MTKNSSCIFPKKYNDTIIINCTIYNITENNTYFEGFEYGNSTDKIKYVHYSFNATTFFNANKILTNHTIIKESNKTGEICLTSNSSSNTSNISNVSDTSSVSNTSNTINNDDEEEEKNQTTNYLTYFKKKSSRGLSTGAIIGIILPCEVVLLAISILALRCRNNEPESRKEISSSEINLKIKY